MTCLFFIAQAQPICALLKSAPLRQRRLGGSCWIHPSRPDFHNGVVATPCVRLSFSTTRPENPSCETSSDNPNNDKEVDDDGHDDAEGTTLTPQAFSPWNNNLSPGEKNEKIVVRRKFRQHVNPLALRYQQPTILSASWPKDVFRDTSLPLILDIGCGKGGFLLDLAQHYEASGDNGNGTMEQPALEQSLSPPPSNSYNYLGLEIRPAVVRYAQSRIDKYGFTGHLDFVGCNANVDLERLLQLYHAADQPQPSNTLHTNHLLNLVTIQFPDPHFKSHHTKRRVVTPQLVQTICRYMPPNGRVFLQSDVKVVLDEMRLLFRQHAKSYLDDVIHDVDQYVEDNILGVSTERERSVLKRNMPVYRAVLKRTDLALDLHFLGPSF